MNARFKLMVIVMTAAFLASSCSRGLRILFYNNSEQALTLSFESDENIVVRELIAGRKAVLIYKSPASITIKTANCVFSYDMPPYDQSYDDFIPSPRERPYQVNLQIESDYKLYIVPPDSKLPVVYDVLADQPKPFFPIKPTTRSCKSD